MSVERRWMAVVVTAVLLVPRAASSQDSNSGTIGGVVRDMSGSVLPGVTVEAASPALIEKVRVAAIRSGNRRSPC